MGKSSIGLGGLGLGLGLGLALATLAPLPAQAAMDWVTKPTSQDLEHAYPPLAAALKIGGRVMLRCPVAAAGVLGACVVEREAPKDLGFGRAALQVAPAFRMGPSPGTPAGSPGQGEVRIPLRFMAPVVAPDPPRVGPPTSPQALVEARRFMAAVDLGAAQRRANLMRIMTLPLRALAETPLWWDGLTALSDAYDALAPEVLEAVAREYAANISAEDLAAATAYAVSPAGRREREVLPTLPQKVGRTDAIATRIGSATARLVFCQDRDCGFGAAAWPTLPQWVEQPSLEQVEIDRPVLARAFQIPGWALLDCQAAGGGVPSGCLVTSEHPAGLGFGQAALKLAGYYRAAGPADGARLPVLVIFFGQAASAEEPPKPPATRAFGLARQLVQIEGLVDQVVAEDERRRRALFGKPLPGVDAATLAAADRAARAGSLAMAAAAVDLRAQVYAELVDEPELAARLDHVQSPAGQALLTFRKTSFEELARVGKAEGERQALRAHDIFCARHGCDDALPADPPPKP